MVESNSRNKIANLCKYCKGDGCLKCDGTGVELISSIEEQYYEASEADGTRIYPDEVGFIEFDEEDYEV